MTDTLFADWAYFQRPINDAYPHPFACHRSNDGIFRDPNFDLNLEWCAKATRRRVKGGRRLVGFAVYFVLRDDVAGSVGTLLSQLGGKRRWWRRDAYNRMAVVIDVESWGGQMGGDHSPSIRYARERIIRELNNRRRKTRRKRHYERDRKRVVVYGNVGDLSSMAPSIGDAKVFVAAYGVNPEYPGKLAHQFSDHYWTPPFGYCDINSADGLSPEEFAVALGLAREPRKARRKHKHEPHPRPHPSPKPRKPLLNGGKTADPTPGTPRGSGALTEATATPAIGIPVEIGS